MSDIQISRKDGETPFDYHKRLIDGKLKDKTLADIDYSELAQLAYGKPYSSDVARRMFYGSRITLDLLEADMVAGASKTKDSEEIAKEIRSQIDCLEKERKRLYDQRREYNKLLASDARQEHLYRYIAEAATNVGKEIGNIFNKVSDIDYSGSENDAVLVFSDWHYGMVADNIFNKFNTDICEKRVVNVVEEAESRIAMHGCRTLHIVILGDLFHGAIHTSARVASEELVCDQIIHVSEILAQAILRLRNCVENICVHMTYGNHARTVQNKSDSIHRDNMEKIIPWWLEWRLKQFDDVVIDNSSGNEFLVFDVLGHGICAAHGDLDSVRTSPKLLGTLFHKQYGKEIECILLGDKHHKESFEELYTTAIMCGSLCGTDDYANEKRLYSSPTQLLLIVNRTCGIDAEYTLRC